MEIENYEIEVVAIVNGVEQRSVSVASLPMQIAPMYFHNSFVEVASSNFPAKIKITAKDFCYSEIDKQERVIDNSIEFKNRLWRD